MMKLRFKSVTHNQQLSLAFICIQNSWSTCLSVGTFLIPVLISPLLLFLHPVLFFGEVTLVYNVTRASSAPRYISSSVYSTAGSPPNIIPTYHQTADPLYPFSPHPLVTTTVLSVPIFGFVWLFFSNSFLYSTYE